MEHIIGGAGNNKAAMNIPPLNTLPVIKCSRCGGLCFDNVFLLRVLSAIQSSDGQEHIIPEPTFRCSHCGTILGTNSGPENNVEDQQDPINDPIEEDNSEPEKPSELKLV